MPLADAATWEDADVVAGRGRLSRAISECLGTAMHRVVHRSSDAEPGWRRHPPAPGTFGMRQAGLARCRNHFKADLINSESIYLHGLDFKSGN